MSTAQDPPRREEQAPAWPCDERALRWIRDRRNQDEYDDRDDREREEQPGDSPPACPRIR
ncbi:hypothetical protein [Nannocystis pusilla]|uniref:hypothetical protein n=1 Tax=Nannocystis pusilla TaxID=889268 RepID=UPI003B7A1ED8